LAAPALPTRAKPQPPEPVLELKKRRNGAPAHSDILPTLFGVGYGNYPVQRGNFLLSLLAHAAVVALAISATIWMAGSHANVSHEIITALTQTSLYIPPEYDQSRGGGGGGDRDKLNASKGKLPQTARDQITPPAVVVRNLESKLPIAPTVVAPPTISLPQTQMGDPLAAIAGPASNGIGSNNGIGSGTGGGIGSGNGNGIGAGWGGGLGGGAYRIGAGVSAPRAIYAPDPEYSDEARKAKYQGVVVLWVVVGADGQPKDIRVSRSLGLGLDQKAIDAVRNWRFEPALKDGRPVAVQLNIEVSFRLY